MRHASLLFASAMTDDFSRISKYREQRQWSPVDREAFALGAFQRFSFENKKKKLRKENEANEIFHVMMMMDDAVCGFHAHGASSSS